MTEWQDISTAPRDGGVEILGYGPRFMGRGHYMETMHFYDGSWSVEYRRGFDAPTHWMPLPDPPA